MEPNKLIDKYIQGRLTPEEVKQFNTLFEEDPSVEEKIVFLENLSIVTGASDRQQLRAQFSVFETKATNTTNTSFPTYKKYGILISIILLIGFGAISFFDPFTVDTQKLYNSYFSPYKNVVTPIIREESTNKEEIAAFKHYKNQEYHIAAHKFDSLYQQTQKSYLLLYQANALLAVKDSDCAIPLLEQHITLKDQLSDRSKWYLALAYLKEDRRAESVFLLQELLRRGTFKQKDATTLLRKLQ